MEPARHRQRTFGRRRLLLAATLAAAVAATSAAGVCGSPDDAPAATPTHTVIDIERPETPPPVTPTALPRKTVRAPIDRLDLVTRESAPPHYAVQVSSGLPDGCTTFKEARVTGRSGATITVEVTNTHPSDGMVACTMIYGTHVETVELGSDFERGTEYTVRVNDKELRFTAQ